MIIDMHTHVVPSHFPDWSREFGQGRWPSWSDSSSSRTLLFGDTPFMKLDERFWTGDRRIADMDAQGVDIQVLSPIPALACYWAELSAATRLSRFFNEHVASLVAERPDRFMGMATLPMQDIDSAVDELRYIQGTLGFRAVQIGTCPANRELDDHDLDAFYRECQALDVAVFVHPIEPLIGRERMNDFYLPNTIGNPLETTLAIARVIFGGVLDRHPTLKICFAHGGGAFAYVLGRADRAYHTQDIARRKTSVTPREQAQRVYVDTLTFDAGSVRLAAIQHGPQRLLLGSDYPFLLGNPDPVRSIEASDLSAIEKRLVFSRNVLDYLGHKARS